MLQKIKRCFIFTSNLLEFIKKPTQATYKIVELKSSRRGAIHILDTEGCTLCDRHLSQDVKMVNGHENEDIETVAHMFIDLHFTGDYDMCNACMDKIASWKVK